MRLNSNKFLIVLKNLDDLSFFKNRKWDKVYSNNTVSYLNYEIWKNILNNENINGEAIDKYEFNKFCRYYLTEIEINILFNRINKKSRCINFDEFNEFMEFLSEKDYLLCINCLEPDGDTETPNEDVEPDGDTETPNEDPDPEPEIETETTNEDVEPDGDTETTNEDPDPEPDGETETTNEDPDSEPDGDTETTNEDVEPEPEDKKVGLIKKKLHDINNFFKNKISIFFNIFK